MPFANVCACVSVSGLSGASSTRQRPPRRQVRGCSTSPRVAAGRGFTITAERKVSDSPASHPPVPPLLRPGKLTFAKAAQWASTGTGWWCTSPPGSTGNAAHRGAACAHICGARIRLHSRRLPSARPYHARRGRSAGASTALATSCPLPPPRPPLPVLPPPPPHPASPSHEQRQAAAQAAAPLFDTCVGVTPRTATRRQGKRHSNCRGARAQIDTRHLPGGVRKANRAVLVPCASALRREPADPHSDASVPVHRLGFAAGSGCTPTLNDRQPPSFALPQQLQRQQRRQQHDGGAPL